MYGELIRNARQRKGWTLSDLAYKLGITPAGIAQWEQNRRNPKLETREKIASALDIDITELMLEPEKSDYEKRFGTSESRAASAAYQIERIIEANTKAETLAAYLSVLPEGTTADDLQDVTVTTANVTGAVKTADGMAVVQSTAAGYSGNLVTVYAAFDTTGTLTALSVDASTQTTGIGSKTGEESFYGGYVGWSASQQVEIGNPVDAIGGATISSRAVVSAINSAIDCYNNEIAGVA